MFKPSKAQQRMIDRLTAGTHVIGYGRNWYAYRINAAGEETYVFMGSKAHDATIDALINAGILREVGDPTKAGFRVELIVADAPAVEDAAPAAKPIASRFVTRVTSVNRDKIVSDARTGFPDDTAFDLTNAGTVIVHSGPFAGMYRVVKVKSPRWIGDNGYTFERDLNAADTIVLNVAYSEADYASATDDHDVRETHFARLVELIGLNSPPASQPAPTTRDQLRPMTPDQIGAEYDSIFAACATEDELESVASGIDFAAMSAGLVAYITASYENAIGRVRRAAQAPAARYTLEAVAHLVTSFGDEATIDFINTKMPPADAFALVTALQCQLDGRAIVNAIRALLIEAREGVIGASVYIATLNRTLVVLDYAIETNVVIVSPRYAGKDDRQGFTLGTEAVIVQTVAQEQQTEADPTPAEHKDRQRVIDRALAANHIVKNDDVEKSNTLREVALDFVKTYRGTSSFVQSVAVWLADIGHISTKQMRGTLNVMIAEAREERAAKAEAARQTSADDVYMDLRGRKERAIDDAGDAVPPADESANEVALAIPNGYYTVIINDAGDYRTLRVGDCPAYFTVKPGTQLISYLSGPENTSDYTGFAFLAGRTVSIWSKFRNAGDLRLAADRLVADPMTGASAYVKRSNRCFVCNHPLTTPESIARGIGPICAQNVEALGYSFNLMGNRDEAVEQVENERAIDTHGINGAFTSKTTKQERLSGARAALARIAADNEARKALDAEMQRQRSASGPITRERAQAEMDELFD